MRYNGKPVTTEDLRVIYKNNPSMLAFVDILEGKDNCRETRIDPAGQVYFTQQGDGEPIKIGYSRDTRNRIRALQSANGRPLTLLATISGPPTKEKELHERFNSFRLHGEWFEPHPKLLGFIESLTAPTTKENRGRKCQTAN